MVKCCSGQTKRPRKTRPGEHTSGNDFFTPDFSSSGFLTPSDDVADGFAVRCATSFSRQAMAYKEANPQTFVRIIASISMRVM